MFRPISVTVRNTSRCHERCECGEPQIDKPFLTINTAIPSLFTGYALRGTLPIAVPPSTVILQHARSLDVAEQHPALRQIGIRIWGWRCLAVGSMR